MAIASVWATVNGLDYEMEYSVSAEGYQVQLPAPERERLSPDKNSYYPVLIRIEDMAGNVTMRTVTDATLGRDLMLVVKEQSVFPLKFILADSAGRELGYVNASKQLDIEIGGSNDFELIVSYNNWSEEMYGMGNRLFVPGTEYGGLIEDRKTSTKKNTISLLGYTWRGLLSQKIIEPPEGLAYLTVSGEANRVMASVLGDRFGTLFEVDTDSSGFDVNYRFNRYTDLLSGFDKMLASVGAKLKIYYKQGEGQQPGSVHLAAVPIADWSEQLEYSQDNKVDFTTRDYKRGINHLICLGNGELEERMVRHLYLQGDGSIGTQPYYTGPNDRTAVYDYSSAEDEESLLEGGRQELAELADYQKIEIDIGDIDIELGDIVGGRDRITGLTLKQPITRKILKFTGNKETIQYKVGGE